MPEIRYNKKGLRLCSFCRRSLPYSAEDTDQRLCVQHQQNWDRQLHAVNTEQSGEGASLVVDKFDGAGKGCKSPDGLVGAGDGKELLHEVLVDLLEMEIRLRVLSRKVALALEQS